MARQLNVRKMLLAINKAYRSLNREVLQQKVEATYGAPVAARDDELGQLARVLQQAAAAVQQRETALKRQLEELQIEIDQAKRQQEVTQITRSVYFQDIQKEVASVDLDEFWA